VCALEHGDQPQARALRRRRLAKVPGVAETIDWAQALIRLRRGRLDTESVEETLGCLLKDRHDFLELAHGGLGPIVAEAREGSPP
jgi:hypothetical protein